eukprot:scaffold7582_cov72-Phaeocystis_antarctica.AAC.8
MLCFVASKDATPILAQTPRLPSRSACEPSRACELAVSAVTSRSAAAALPGDEARPTGGLAEARRAGGLADERRTPLPGRRRRRARRAPRRAAASTGLPGARPPAATAPPGERAVDGGRAARRTGSRAAGAASRHTAAAATTPRAVGRAPCLPRATCTSVAAGLAPHDGTHAAHALAVRGAAGREHRLAVHDDEECTVAPGGSGTQARGRALESVGLTVWRVEAQAPGRAVGPGLSSKHLSPAGLGPPAGAPFVLTVEARVARPCSELASQR